MSAKQKRRHVSLTTKLASALLMIPQRDSVGRPLLDGLGHLVPMISLDEARSMTADQVCSLFEYDHSILHAIDGPALFWNLTPRFIAEHRAKTKKDKAALAKIKRAEKRRDIGPRVCVINSMGALNAQLDKLPKHAPDRRKQKMPHGRGSATKKTFRHGVVAR